MTAPAVDVEMIDSEAGLVALEDEWRTLFDSAGQPSPFLDFDWVLMCWRRMATRRPRVALVREGGRLVLAVALRRRPFRRFFERYCAAATDLPQYDDVLMAPGDGATTWVEALSRALGRDPRTRSMVLNRLPETSPVLALLGTRVLSNASYGPAARVDLAHGYAAYFNRFSGTTRSQIRRLERRLDEQGELELRQSTPQTCDTALDWLFESKRSWTPPNNRLRVWLTDPHYERDIRTLARHWVANGKMWLPILFSGDRPVAGAMVFTAGTGVALYMVTYDPAFSIYSPGRMLTLKLIEYADTRGFTSVDLMLGEFEWKRRLQTESRAVRRVKVRLG